MNISEQITALNTDKTAIANAITAKGGTLSQNAGFDTFATDIATIPSGGDPNTYANQIMTNSIVNLSAGIMDRVYTIRNSMFNGNTQLTSVFFPDSIRNVEDNAFLGCTSLLAADFSDCNLLIKIGESAFSGCSSLATVKLPTNAYWYTIVRYACFQRTAISEIEIPSSVTEIRSTAFANCSSLAKVTVLATTPPALANVNAFSGTDANLVIYVPSASVSDYQSASNWSTYASRIQAIPS